MRLIITYVAAAVKKLKVGKAAGPDGLLGEHLKWGGEAVLVWLQGVVNSIVESEAVPSVVKAGIVVPVHCVQRWRKGPFKGGQLPRSDINIDTGKGSGIPHCGAAAVISVGGWTSTHQSISLPERGLLCRGHICNTGDNSTVHAWW